MDSEHAQFLEAVRASIEDGSFAKLTLGKYRGDSVPQKGVASLVMVRGARHLRVVISQPKKDLTRNYAIGDGIAHLKSIVGQDFLSATMFSTKQDVTLTYSKKKLAQLTTSRPTLLAPQSTTHDREKPYLVDAGSDYLKELGITHGAGRVKPSMYPKYKQICHFIEIIEQLLRSAPAPLGAPLCVIDIGSGKGYLTFALYHYLTKAAGIRCTVLGLDVNPDLVQFCNGLAARVGFTGLSFEAADAKHVAIANASVLIALHACDTATDDAIYHGIAANASLIVCAPCCQHQIAPQLNAPGEAIQGLMKFGLLKQRQADLVTDAARALLLEASGYKVRIIEFVSTEHSPKNLMIAGIRSADVDRAAARRQYDRLKRFMGFEAHALEQRLAGRLGQDGE